MKRIGVISDTHIPVSAQTLPRKVYEIFQGVDLILHAGDILAIKVIDDLSKIAPTHAVQGNMDGPPTTGKFPVEQVVEVEGVRIGLAHGSGAPDDIIERLKNRFKDQNVQAIVFGHTHEPYNAVHDNILFFNPGSPTDAFFAPYNAVGILEVDGPKIVGKIEEF
jgi:uncharacterized protein